MNHKTGLIRPLRAVLQIEQEDGVFYWALECGHRERIGLKPAAAQYRACGRCLMDAVTDKAKESDE